MMYESKFNLGDKVSIDGDTSLVGTVTGVKFLYAEGQSILVSWMHNGCSYSAWIEDIRLAHV